MAPPIIKRFLISLNEHKFLGFLVFILILGISVVVAIQPQEEIRRYKAIGRLSFSSPPPTFTVAGQELQIRGFAVNINTLLSPGVLERVAERLEFSVRKLQEIIIRKKLRIILPQSQGDKGGPQLITLQYQDDKNPEEAKLIVDVFMEEMVEESYFINTAQLQNRIQSLEERLIVVQKDLTEAERAFYNYLSKEGSSLLSIQDGSLLAAIAGSQQQKRDLKVVLSGVEAEIESLEKQLGLTSDQAYTSAALSADPIIANLRALILQNEIQLERLGKDLRPEHPTIVELQKQQAVNEKLLEERAEEVIGNDGLFKPLSAEIRQDSNLDPTRLNLAARLVALESQREAIESQLESVIDIEENLRQEYELFPDKQLMQTRLIQQVQSQRVLYQTVFAALMDAKSAEVETGSSLAIAQTAFIPPQQQLSSEQSTALILLSGLGIAVATSVGLIFLFATLDDRFHTPEELRVAFVEREVPVLGELPVIQFPTASGKKIPVLLETNSGYLSFYERFRSNIRRLGAEDTKVILLTSVSNQEGKSVCAYNLAIASAHAGKRTLLIEADLRTRSPGSRKYFNIEPRPESINNPVSYYDLRNDSISLVPNLENLYILPSPGFQQQAAAIIESNEMQRLLRDVRARYDMVIIDTPSLYRCNDALLLEPLADGIVIVTRPGVTLKSLLGETIDEFIEGELPLIGGVINDVEKLTPRPEFSPEPDFNFSLEHDENDLKPSEI